MGDSETRDINITKEELLYRKNQSPNLFYQQKK